MRKRLILLTLALAAFTAASAVSTASAQTCPKGTYVFTCGSRTICCPIGAFCACGT